MVAVNAEIEELVQFDDDIEFLENSVEFRDNYDETDRAYVLADPKRTREMASYIARFRLDRRIQQTTMLKKIEFINWKEEGF